ncbi:hypothetical protein COK34_06935 [Bacillus thuringiensis]|uniref:KAP family P-loop NTPase fold protein n=1 Tax=Bacillus thuringiensis TaxID=1428 RepID=UPI000BF50D0E|nr:P-loop NTPase fold protein [Bacillus thuringiensis]PFD66889.1 hypothetical protein CN309_08455 [Bacillus thuringiensis]PFO46542.1 hypothetical protein COJ84_01380 [Bacillus thuringiensis]PFR56344.1 hypothetical protein COK34_06935 [Bacillus thuringiensis]
MNGHLPLTNIESDKLHFSTKAKEIAKFIEAVPNNIPYALSVNGSWGSGKSSMLNFIEGELNNNIYKVVRFNPWMINNKEELILHLFEEIYDCIDRGAKNAKEKFKDYALKIASPLARLTTLAVSASQGVPTQFITPFVNAAGDIAKETGEVIFNKPLSKRKIELIDELKMMFDDNGQKVVVMIDEVDRLFPDEIVNIFQLIKSTLDLPGLFFVVAMDETAVCDALESKGIKNPSIYLQKIFQRKYIVNSQYQLRTLFEEYIIKDVQESYDTYNQELIYLLDTFIRTNPNNRLGTTDSEYTEMYHDLREHLENPRAFVKFKDFLFEKWEKYHSEIPEYNDRNIGLQVAFVVLINFYLYPNYNNPTFGNLDYIFQDKTNSIPKFVLRANNMILSINGDRDRTFEIENFVREIVFNLNKYPDYIRGLKGKV